MKKFKECTNEEIKLAIEKLMTNPDLYYEFSKNALKRSEEFTNEKMVEKYLKVYEN